MGTKRHLCAEYSCCKNFVVELPAGVEWDDIDWYIKWDVFYWWLKSDNMDGLDQHGVNKIQMTAKDIEIGDTTRPLDVEVYMVDEDGGLTWDAQE